MTLPVRLTGGRGVDLLEPNATETTLGVFREFGRNSGGGGRIGGGVEFHQLRKVIAAQVFDDDMQGHFAERPEFSRQLFFPGVALQPIQRGTFGGGQRNWDSSHGSHAGGRFSETSHSIFPRGVLTCPRESREGVIVGGMDAAKHCRWNGIRRQCF